MDARREGLALVSPLGGQTLQAQIDIMRTQHEIIQVHFYTVLNYFRKHLHQFCFKIIMCCLIYFVKSPGYFSIHTCNSYKRLNRNIIYRIYTFFVDQYRYNSWFCIHFSQLLNNFHTG